MRPMAWLQFDGLRYVVVRLHLVDILLTARRCLCLTGQSMDGPLDRLRASLVSVLRAHPLNRHPKLLGLVRYVLR